MHNAEVHFNVVFRSEWTLKENSIVEHRKYFLSPLGLLLDLRSSFVSHLHLTPYRPKQLIYTHCFLLISCGARPSESFFVVLVHNPNRPITCSPS